MFFFLVLGFLGTAKVLAQPGHPDPFAYKGCANIDISCFGDPVALPSGLLSNEMCLTACQGHKFAALLPDACLCGDDVKGIKPIKESACNNACMGDPSLGMCGSICQSNDPAIANVWCIEPAPELPPDTEQSPLPAPPVQSAQVPCTTSIPVYGGSLSSQAPIITISRKTLSLPPPLRSSQPSPETPCASEGPQSQPSKGTPTPPHGTPEPPTYPTPADPPPALTPGSSLPESSAECAISSPEPYSSPGGRHHTSCVVSPEASPSPTTLWPKPSSKTYGDPPVPSQVPGSDSTPAIIPPLSAIGGLAFIAAMIF